MGKFAVAFCSLCPHQLYRCRPNYLKDYRVDRQEKLLEAFHFTCTCRACKFNYQTIDDLKIVDNDLLLYLFKEQEALLNNDQFRYMTPRQIHTKVQEYYLKIQENFHKYKVIEPRQELVSLDKMIAELLPKVASTVTKYPAARPKQGGFFLCPFL